jgi:hypothetical protein
MLIGLTGRPGAGKDSAALVLCAAGWHSVALADALRVEVAAAWGIDPRLLTERKHKEHTTPQLAVGGGANANWLRWAAVHGHSLIAPRSPRWVMQAWGSFRRTTDPDYWVRHVGQWITWQRAQGAHSLVVTDVRLPNEVAELRALGGRILRVHRPDALLAPLATDTAAHASEHTAAQIEADGDIVNDGSLGDLAGEVWRAVQGLAS